VVLSALKVDTQSQWIRGFRTYLSGNGGNPITNAVLMLSFMQAVGGNHCLQWTTGNFCHWAANFEHYFMEPARNYD